MNQTEFVARYRAEEPLFATWGRCVIRHVSEGVQSRLDSGESLNHFFKISPASRTKAVDSLVEKGYYRGKGYADPYAAITDKVGTRFVVLLLDQIKVVEDAVLTCSLWTASKDRDFEKEREERPTVFDYQSVHYVVRSKAGVTFEGTALPEGIPCEIQVRTLLQHAFSELTHDTIYKPRTLTVPLVRREVAKSMALIETTDQIFREVSLRLQEASSQADQWLRILASLYPGIVGREPSTNIRVNAFVLDALEEEWKHYSPEGVTEFLERSPALGRWVNERYDTSFLFRQPAILLIYFLAAHRRVDLARDWPFTRDELVPIYTDLGYAIA